MNENKLLLVLSLLIILVFCVLAIYDIVHIMTVKNIPLVSIDSPLVFYSLLTLVITVLTIYVVIDEARKGNISFSASREIKTELKKVIVYALGTMVYIYLLRKLHFTKATLLFVFVVIMVLNNTDKNLLTKVLKSAISACITVPILYYVFHGIFQVILP